MRALQFVLRTRYLMYRRCPQRWRIATVAMDTPPNLLPMQGLYYSNSHCMCIAKKTAWIIKACCRPPVGIIAIVVIIRVVSRDLFLMKWFAESLLVAILYMISYTTHHLAHLIYIHPSSSYTTLCCLRDHEPWSRSLIVNYSIKERQEFRRQTRHVTWVVLSAHVN